MVARKKKKKRKVATRKKSGRESAKEGHEWMSGMSPLEIDLDPRSPRLHPDERDSTQAELIEIMIRRFRVVDLGESIAETGYSDFDPLIGYRDGDTIVVREGNRRIAALKLLLNPDLAPNRYRSRWEALAESAREHAETIESVRIKVYDDPDDIELESYIGFRHVSGILQWPAQEKARFIVDMVDRHGWTYEEIAKRIGSYPRHVERHYIASRLIGQAEEEGVAGAEYIQIGVPAVRRSA